MHVNAPSKIFLTRSFLKTVSCRPGVYIMNDGSGHVLYVGKARDLKKRLSSYVQAVGRQYPKTSAMLAQVRYVETILTTTEKEALILEASLIKKHRPKYNVILRDDKNYPLIKVTVNETWPRVMIVRRRQKDGSRYFGPFSSPSAMRATISYLNTLFPLRRCKGKKLKKRTRPCLNFQMRRCLAPCCGKVDSKEYQEMVRGVLLALEGKNKQLVKELEMRMRKAAENLDFEQAAFLRDQIQALQKTLEKQVVAGGHFRDQDVFGFVREDVGLAISIITVRRGVVSGHRSFLLSDPMEKDARVLAEALTRFYENDNPVPDEIVLPFEAEGLEVLTEWLIDLRGKKTTMLVPRRGDRLTLVRMAEANAKQALLEYGSKKRSWQVLSRSVRDILALTRLPNRIECLDISNIGGELAVGSLVCFIHGEKTKAEYRHYRIRTVSGPDDYAMMAEVFTRRFRNKAENRLRLPDLLLVDGGKGQLNVAVSILRELDLSDAMDLAGIAKEKAGEGEKLYRPGRKNPIILPRHSPVLLLLMRIRDESHRFGITLHRKLRGKAALKSVLDEISGIGPARKKALLKTFGGIKGIQEAPLAQLSKVAGIGSEVAESIWRYFHE